MINGRTTGEVIGVQSTVRRLMFRSVASSVAVVVIGLGLGAASAGAATPLHHGVRPHHVHYRPHKVRLEGKVTAIGTGNFTISHGVSTITVDVSSSTLYFEQGVTNATFANLVVG